MTLMLPALVLVLAQGQVPSQLAQERAAFADWLRTAPHSPLAARAMIPIGTGIVIGPDTADVPIPGVSARVSRTGGPLRLESGGTTRMLPRYRPVTIGPVTVMTGGAVGRELAVVYGGERRERTPTYYPYDPALVFTGPLNPVEPVVHRILALDGFEVEATEVGTVRIPDSAGPATLHVYRIPDPGTEESELMIYFRDATNDHGSYPAGRFVSLVPLPDGRYRLDFNRARNPFCAYNSAYPCPAPWPGNQLARAIPAGEQYRPATPDRE